MTVVDTSAIMAVLLREQDADACSKALDAEVELLISAGTLSEVLVVAGGRRIAHRATALIDALGINVVSVTEATARRIGEARTRWGKGFHPAGLNFGDCFAYVLAKERGCALLYVGEDFAKTDIVAAL